MATSSDTVVQQQQQKQQQRHQSIILFYKYHRLSAADRSGNSNTDTVLLKNCCSTAEPYRQALEELCQALDLKGRILVSADEGLNGTLAGTYDNVLTFTRAMGGQGGDEKDHEDKGSPTTTKDDKRQFAILQDFWKASSAFFQNIHQPVLTMPPEEFKWSSAASASSNSTTTSETSDSNSQQQQLFPDLNIKLTTELIGSGGVMLKIPVEETAKGYLTPQQWHEQLMKLEQEQQQQNDGDKDTTNTILIDCRNTKEYQIGHFCLNNNTSTGNSSTTTPQPAIDPQTTVYSQFPTWVQQNAALLDGKNVLMYCTGGIRCEKASAYVRQHTQAVQVQHLKGGIHKYLEEYGSDGLWKGKNFVFDARQASSAEETRSGKDGLTLDNTSSSSSNNNNNNNNSLLGVDSSNNNNTLNHQQQESIVGKCSYCQSPHDTFDAGCVCTVCREPVLICPNCRAPQQDADNCNELADNSTRGIVEFHCPQHFHLRNCYFAQLERFHDPQQLKEQLAGLQAELERIAVGRRFKQKRKTLARQCAKVADRLKEVENKAEGQQDGSNEMEGDGCHLKCRSCGQVGCRGNCWGFFGLKRKDILESNNKTNKSDQSSVLSNTSTLTTALHAANPKKKARRGADADEISTLGFHQSPSAFRHKGGLRCPPCVTRMVQSSAKAKWCGEAVLHVLQTEFAEFSSSSQNLQSVLENGLIKVNDKSISPMDACHVKLKSGDVLSRVLHWHEPPVQCPEHIDVSAVPLPEAVIKEYGIPSGEEVNIFVCNKPSSVPVHPAGPFLANSLTVMVEAQEKLPSCSLKPIHRTDRATSGLTLMSNSSAVAKIFHRALTEMTVEKLYIAKVHGQFPDSAEAMAGISGGTWNESHQTVKVDAPILTPDPTSGIRIISDQGKSALSVFKLLKHNPDDNTSVIACFPITGRNHQLRVHLQSLGFSILGDTQYGGRIHNSTQPDRLVVLETMNACSSHPNDEKILPHLQMHDIHAARKVCRSCRGSSNNGSNENTSSFETSFTAAQLLQGGHAICLHAYRYRVAFPTKKKHVGQSQLFAERSEYRVGLPAWAVDAVDEKDSRLLEEVWSSAN